MMSKLFPVEVQSSELQSDQKNTVVDNKPYWTKFWFSLVVVTAIYLVIFFLTGGLRYDKGLNTPLSFFSQIGAMIGLFVPFGFWNFSIIIETPFVLIFIPLYFFITRIDRYSIRYSFSNKQKILVNIFILFLLTIIIDLIIYQEWASFKVFINGGINL